ncbi:MAG: hypothetical protein Q4C97_04030 [Bacillota bacterium]|nr:hypothetical protein [Bacillota bacterium]
MIEKYTISKDTDMMAPRWLAECIDCKTAKLLYGVKDGAVKLKGVKINGRTAKIGDTVYFDGKRVSVGRR